MIKRIKLDANGALTEIDWQLADQAALALRRYVDAAPSAENRAFEYNARIRPVIEATLDRSIAVPFPLSCKPYDMRAQREGWEPALPDTFSELYAQFIQIITGSPAASSLSTHETGQYVFGMYRDFDAAGDAYELCWIKE